VISVVREVGLENYIIDGLVKRGWKYIDSSSLSRIGPDKPLLYNVLRRKIKEFNPIASDEDVAEAVSLLEGRSYGPRGAREVLEYLKFGVPVKLRETRTSARLKLIDYVNPGRNEFIVSSQVTHTGRGTIRNDILLYVNGIPLVSIEVKNPTDPGVSWRDAFLQVKRYEEAVPELYKYVQVGVAVEAVARYFPIVPWTRPEEVVIYEWKEEGLDSIDSTIELFRPERLLDFLRFYTYFRMEEGRETKVLARYMQYRAANKIVERVLARLRGVEDKDRGLVWHWQGSGKTLTMIFAAMKLYWLLENPTIFFVVDRIELQNQLYYENLTKLDLGPEVRPKLVDKIERLQRVLSYNDYRGEPGIFVVTVQKFLPSEFEELEKMLRAVSRVNPHSIRNRMDVVVLVDEAHRTQYGVLAEQMMRLLRKANYFAFTGTPVPRRNPLKNTFAKFSPPDELYLDKYFILDSIQDGYTVRIAYQPGPFDYKLDRQLLDEFLESEFDELPVEVRRIVERRVGRELDVRKFKVFLENEERIDRVARYIARHFKENVDGKFKAMVVAASRKACVLYKRALDRYLPSEYSEVVMTFQSQEREEVIEEYRRELMERFRVTDPRDAVHRIIEKFRTEDNPRILVVTDMLLTGFDAPILQTMYLDKPLKGHRLLQAIARVNRPYKGVKEYGLIIDFVGIFDELERAFNMYESEDLKGAVFDVDAILEEFRKRLKRLIDIVGPRPKVSEERELISRIKIIAGNLARDKEKEREFLENYRVLRKLYELIAPKLERGETTEYKWVAEIYTYYVKNLIGSSPEEELADRYYRKTIEAVGKALRIVEKEAEFSPISIDRSFFEKFIESREVSVEEKASTLLLGLTRFALYSRNDPVYVSLSDKIEKILEAWKRKLKTSLELYEEAKSIWREIYGLREEQRKLGFDRREYGVYLTLKSYGFSERRALEVTRRLMSAVKDLIDVPGWSSNPALVSEVKRRVAFTILRESKRVGIPVDRAKKLINAILEGVRSVEPS